MQYGEGKNHVAGLLRVQCPKGYVVVSSDNPYWASCKTVLIQSADVVIKGTR
jgi:selenophosphate synthetase-related protein